MRAYYKVQVRGHTIKVQECGRSIRSKFIGVGAGYCQQERRQAIVSKRCVGLLSASEVCVRRCVASEVRYIVSKRGAGVGLLFERELW